MPMYSRVQDVFTDAVDTERTDGRAIWKFEKNNDIVYWSLDCHI